MRAVVLVMLCACGRLGFDDRVDVVEPRGTVSIVAASHFIAPTTGPLVGAIVWSTTPEGALDDVTATDEAGQAVVEVDRGGSVSTYDQSSLWVTTFVEVEPGDVLQIGVPFPLCSQATTGTVTLDWMPPAGATRFETLVGCQTQQATIPPLAVPVDASVREPFDVVLRAYDGDALVASATKRGVAFHDGITHAFASAEWMPGIERTIGLRGVSIADAQLSALLSTADASLPNADLVTSVATGTDTVSVTKVVPADATRMTIAALGGRTEGNEETATVFLRVDVPLGISTVVPAPAPPIGATWDAATGTVAWTLSSTTAMDSFDALVGFLDATETLTLVWSVRTPPDARAVTFPVLPPGVMIDLTATTAPEYYLLSNNFEEAQSYRQARQLGEGFEGLFASLGFPFPAKHSGAFSLRTSQPVTARRVPAMRRNRP